jgi:hypothetical protein
MPKGKPASIMSCPNILIPIGSTIRAIQEPMKDSNTPKPRATLIPKRSIIRIAGMHMRKYITLSK